MLVCLLVFLPLSLPAADAITNADEALAAFRAIMRKSVEERTGRKIPDDNKKDDRTGATESTSLAVYKRVKDTLLPNQYKSAIRVGTVASLLPDRKVWVISHSFDVYSAFDAILDAKSGKLIFMWFIPEG